MLAFGGSPSANRTSRHFGKIRIGKLDSFGVELKKNSVKIVEIQNTLYHNNGEAVIGTQSFFDKAAGGEMSFFRAQNWNAFLKVVIFGAASPHEDMRKMRST